METQKPSGPVIRLGLFELLVVVVIGTIVWFYVTGNIKITDAPASATLPPPTAIATSTVGSDILSLSSNQNVNPVAQATPIPLPPSHEGGQENLVVGSGQLLKGFPDAGVEMDIPENAVLKPARFSWYWPNLGGTNCSSFSGGIPSWAADFPNADQSNGWCWSSMSNGERWEYFVGRAVACPQEWPFETKVYAFGREWLCKDHGGKIETISGRSWIDFLTPQPPLTYRTEFDVYVVYP